MRSVVALLRLTAAIVFLGPARAHEPATEKLAPYYPTPEIIVEKMLELGELKAGQKMFDLGSGDGRIVIAAARKFKADPTGVEFDASLARQSAEGIKNLGLESTARLTRRNPLHQRYSS